jgi:hypothetical protein
MTQIEADPEQKIICVNLLHLLAKWLGGFRFRQ